jgi:membrane associated rhomboid family serine protease
MRRASCFHTRPCVVQTRTMTTGDVLQALHSGRAHFGPGFWLVLALLVTELANLLTLRSLNTLGIRPREVIGLPGILVSPLLHVDLKHFAANFPPALVLCFVLGQLLPAQLVPLLGAMVLGTGLLVWLLARRLVHVGASGVIHALFGFLTLHGFLSGDVLHAVVAIAMLLLYSGILWGIIPKTAQTSWESHVAGLAVGLALAWWEPHWLLR